MSDILPEIEKLVVDLDDIGIDHWLSMLISQSIVKMAMYCPQGSGMLRQQLLMWPKYSQNVAKM